MTNLDSILKRREIILPTKVHLVKAMVFPVVMYGCESWTERKLSTEELMLLNSGVGEDSWESLGLQGDPWVHPKGNQSWIFIGKADAEAETPIIWPPDAKSWLIWKDPDAGKDWGWEEKGTTRGWGGWMASPTRWTWVWGNPDRRPGMLWCMGSQRVGHDWATELNWILE